MARVCSSGLPSIAALAIRLARSSRGSRDQVREAGVELVEDDFPGPGLLLGFARIGARPAQVGIGPAEQPLRQPQHVVVLRLRDADDVENDA
jgi:hypothetical protein